MGCLFLGLNFRSHVFTLKIFSQGHMLSLRLRQVSQQLSRRRVADFTCSALVETLGLSLHYLCLAPNRFDSEWPDHPNRFPMHKPLHVFATDQRDVFSKAATVFFNQFAAMLILFRLHFRKDLGGCWVIGFQSR